MPRNHKSSVTSFMDAPPAITFSPAICAKRLMISSARPSLKYSCSASALRLAKGRTAIHRLCASDCEEPVPSAAARAELEPLPLPRVFVLATYGAGAFASAPGSGISNPALRRPSM
jgi:hypothetical protein